MTYIDDIILNTSSHDLRKSIMTFLVFEFSMKDLYHLSYFLKIVMIRHASGLFLNQSIYESDIIACTDMTSCNPSATLVDTKQKLSTSSDILYEDPTMYQNLFGIVQYLTFILLDISYVVQ
ncbi:uncharacterized mitochondrial protein AtMg00810-like [Vigna angularis]|uniref:uncharacterized mitochondrial protein AtMg00810-like n=1 Tax=Phaseolus angularis TaxID=3914 RepID=UPI00080A65B7|nr:uncharacterized mitochondrial protein AtMg00810-like [Vigna angularis]